MQETEIRRYAVLMEELGLTGLEITDETSRVRLERSVPASGTELRAPVPAPAAGTDPVPEGRDCISIRSPFVGIFYSAPAENAEPYVSIGDHVTKGRTLCIVEAMKLMNEIKAEEEGIVSEICVTNGQVVEYGTELFQIKRLDNEQR